MTRGALYDFSACACAPRRSAPDLEHFPAKWALVRRRKCDQCNKSRAIPVPSNRDALWNARAPNHLPRPKSCAALPPSTASFSLARQERAVLADIVDALPVGTEALEVRHVGAPYQLGCAEQIAHLADEFLRLRIRILPDAAPGDRKHDLDQQIVALVGREHLGREIPLPAAGEVRDRRPHHQHEAHRRMALHQPVERHQVGDVACLVVVRRRRELDEGRKLERRDLVPERPERVVIEVARVAVAREVVRVVEALQPERRCARSTSASTSSRSATASSMCSRPVNFSGILALRERVVVVHRAVAAARLQDAVIDAGIEHLRDHEFGRRLDRLHADRHVLDGVFLALVHELEPAVAADAEADVVQAGPGVVAVPEQHRRA